MLDFSDVLAGSHWQPIVVADLDMKCVGQPAARLRASAGAAWASSTAAPTVMADAITAFRSSPSAAISPAWLASVLHSIDSRAARPSVVSEYSASSQPLPLQCPGCFADPLSRKPAGR